MLLDWQLVFNFLLLKSLDHTAYSILDLSFPRFLTCGTSIGYLVSLLTTILNKRIAKSIAIFWFWNCVPYCPFLNPSHSQYSHVTSLHESPWILVALSTCFGSNYLNKMKGTNHWRIKKAGKNRDMDRTTKVDNSMKKTWK